MSRQSTSVSLPNCEEMKPVQTSLPEELDAQVWLWNLSYPSADWPARQWLYIDGRKPTGKAYSHRYYPVLFPLIEIWQWDLKIQYIILKWMGDYTIHILILYCVLWNPLWQSYSLRAMEVWIFNTFLAKVKCGLENKVSDHIL